jgi:hypothetical protein
MVSKSFKIVNNIEWVILQFNFSDWTNLINSIENQKANIAVVNKEVE